MCSGESFRDWIAMARKFLTPLPQLRGGDWQETLEEFVRFKTEQHRDGVNVHMLSPEFAHHLSKFMLRSATQGRPRPSPALDGRLPYVSPCLWIYGCRHGSEHAANKNPPHRSEVKCIQSYRECSYADRLLASPV